MTAAPTPPPQADREAVREAELSQARARIAELEKALNPFAEDCKRQERVRWYRDGDCLVVDSKTTIGQLRRARAALSGEDKEETK